MAGTNALYIRKIIMTFDKSIDSDERFSSPTNTAHVVISDISSILAKKNVFPSLFQDNSIQYPLLTDGLSDHAKWLYHHIYSVAYPGIQNDGKLARVAHGIAHVSRVANYITVLANLYRKHQVPGEENLTAEDVKLLQIAALFHDSAREDEDADRWDHESALLLYHYLRKNMGVDKDKAAMIAEATANKDRHEDGYFIIREHDDGSIIGQFVDHNSEHAHQKTIYHQLIHDADCLDIIRARPSFDANYLDFYQLKAKDNELAFEEMALLISEARSLIRRQGDTWGNYNMGIKARYEQEHGFHEMANDMEHSDYRILSSLNKELLSKEQLEQLILVDLTPFDSQEELTQENLTAALREGKILARSISYPSEEVAFSLTSGIKGNKAEIEFKKTMRRKGIATSSSKEDKTEKEGNPNRSMTMLYGSGVFSEVGVLVINPDLSDISLVSDVDIDSSYGKKGHLKSTQRPSDQEIETQCSNLLKTLKMGGKAYVRPDGTVFSHNELLYRCKQYDATYFTVENNDKYTRTRNLLTAVFIRNEYEKLYDQTRHSFCAMYGEESGNEKFLAEFGNKRSLPILEYSNTQNQMHPVSESELTDEHILDLWDQICSDYITVQLESGNREVLDEPVDVIKIRSLYYVLEYREIDVPRNETEKTQFTIPSHYLAKFYGHGSGLKPADSNYPIELQQQINQNVEEARQNVARKFDEQLFNEIESGHVSIFSQRIYNSIRNNPEMLEKLRSDKTALERYFTTYPSVTESYEPVVNYNPLIGVSKPVPQSALSKKHWQYNTPIMEDRSISFHHKIELAQALGYDVYQLIHNEIQTRNSFDLNYVAHMVLGDFEDEAKFVDSGTTFNPEELVSNHFPHLSKSCFIFRLFDNWLIDREGYFYDHINKKMQTLSFTEELDVFFSTLTLSDMLRIVNSLESGALKGPFEISKDALIHVVTRVQHDFLQKDKEPLDSYEEIKKFRNFLDTIELLLLLVPESDFSIVMDTIIKPVLFHIESEYRSKNTTDYDTSEYRGLFNAFLQHHAREIRLEHNRELFITASDGNVESKSITNESSEDANECAIASSSQDTTALDLLKKQVTEQNKTSREELCFILQSGYFVEPGVTLKSQLYPNLVKLIDSLQANEDFEVIKVIAVKGIEKNAQSKDENPNRDPEQIDKRLIVFKAIEQAHSLEEALKTIKHELPECINEHDEKLQIK